MDFFSTSSRVGPLKPYVTGSRCILGKHAEFEEDVTVIHNGILFGEIVNRIGTRQQVFALRFQRLWVSFSSMIFETVGHGTSSNLLDECVQMSIVRTRIRCVLVEDRSYTDTFQCRINGTLIVFCHQPPRSDGGAGCQARFARLRAVR